MAHRIAVIANKPVSVREPRPDAFKARYHLLVSHLARRDDVILLTVEGNVPRFDAAADDQPAGVRWIRVTRPELRGRLKRVRRLGWAIATAVWPRRPQRLDRMITKTIDLVRPEIVIGVVPFEPELMTPLLGAYPTVLFAEEDLEFLSASRPPAGPFDRLLWSTERSALHRRRPAVDAVVVISERERRWADETYPSSRVAVIPHFLDLDYWCDEAVSRHCEFDVFAIGDFAAERNAHGMAEVLRCLTSLSPGATIRIASHRPLHDELSREVGGQVEFIGPVDDPRPYYRSARTCLVPAFEVSGVKTQILQGWATQCPVVTTDAAAATVSGDHGENLLAGPAPAAVAELLAACIADDPLRGALASAGLVAVRRNHSPEQAKDILDSLLEDVVRVWRG